MLRLVCASVALLLLHHVAALDNKAFVFVKPHALREEVVELVREKLELAGLTIAGEGVIGADKIARNSHIDHHYGVIAKRSFNMHPSELVVPVKGLAAFQNTAGMSWQEALEQKKVFNAKQAMVQLQIDGMELDNEWTKLRKGVDLVKMGSGFYVGSIRGIFVVNGFYLAMREEYVTLGAAIQYFEVGWSAAMSWSDFRGNLLGATDPSAAPSGSIRGTIYANYESLGLPSLPHTGTNGVHASASPLEAMVERMNWLNATIKADPFGAALIAAGVPEGTINYWSKDPQVEYEGQRQSLFDLVEDTTATECLSVLVKLGGRDSACSCRDIVPCGFFAWKSLSDHTLGARKKQCSSTALVPCGHFERAFKSVSEQTLAQRLAQCNTTALVPCGHFERAFKSISTYFMSCSEPLLGRPSDSGQNASLEDLIILYLEQMGGGVSEPCMAEDCLLQAVEYMNSMLQLSEGDDEDTLVWGEENHDVRVDVLVAQNESTTPLDVPMSRTRLATGSSKQQGGRMNQINAGAALIE